MEEKRARGEILTRYKNSMRDHQKNLEKLANKKKPERLRTNFDFDLWGEKGKKPKVVVSFHSFQLLITLSINR